MTELATLVEQAQRGDPDAFGRLIGRFQNMAFAAAYSLVRDAALAEEVAQEAFLEAYLKLTQLRETAAFPAWFRRVLFKQGHRLLRQRRVEIQPLESSAPLIDPLPSPAAALDAQLRRETLQSAIDRLPHGQRLVLLLYYIEGYAVREIADFLELPVTTIKKRLYDARKGLKESDILMAMKPIQQQKPSQNPQFAAKIQFFTALRAGDTATINKILQEQPNFVHLVSEWTVVSDSYYWPLGTTPLFWAAGMGQLDLMKLLLEKGADVNGRSPNHSDTEYFQSSFTPLHHAVIMGQHEAAKLLLAEGAAVNQATSRELTALHYAVIRQQPDIARLLLQHGADVAAKGRRGHTPLAWALQKGDQSLAALLREFGAEEKEQAKKKTAASQAIPSRIMPAINLLLGQMVDKQGQPLDGQAIGGASQTIRPFIAQPPPALLETGLKVVDCFAPLRRGGQIGLFTPLSGVGRLFLQMQIMESVVSQHDGAVVLLGQTHGAATPESLRLAWQGELNLPPKLLDERLVSLFAPEAAKTADLLTLAETGLNVAEKLQQQGREVLLLVQAPLTSCVPLVQLVRRFTAVSPQAAVTTLFDGDFTVGLEPPHFANLDGLLTFDRTRARQGFWPALDLLRSSSTLLARPDLLGERHVGLVQQMRPLLKRYDELHTAFEAKGEAGLFYLQSRDADGQTARRARRLHRFLSQPFVCGELFAGIPGTAVSLADTLAGCEAIMQGGLDEVEEAALFLIGTIAEARR